MTGNRKRRFSGHLEFRHFRKWGHHYCIILFSPLSPFHWPQNTWPWMTLNGHFMLNFHYYEQPFYILTVESVYTRDCRAFVELVYIMYIIMWPAEKCRSGPWSAEYLGSAGLQIFRRCYIVRTLTNKTIIIIQYYLVPYRLSTDSKTHVLEYPLCVKLHRYVWSSEAWLSKLGCS